MPAWIAQLCQPPDATAVAVPETPLTLSGGIVSPLVVAAPADDVARARLNRAVVVYARRDVGRGTRNTVDGVRGGQPGRQQLLPQQVTLPVPAWIAQLWKPPAAMPVCGTRNAIDRVEGRRLAESVVAPADRVGRARLDRAAVGYRPPRCRSRSPKRR